MTAYVVSGLGQAKDAGYTVEDDRQNKGRAVAVARSRRIPT